MTSFLKYSSTLPASTCATIVSKHVVACREETNAYPGLRDEDLPDLRIHVLCGALEGDHLEEHRGGLAIRVDALVKSSPGTSDRRSREGKRR